MVEPKIAVNILLDLVLGLVLNLYLQRLSLIKGFEIPIFDTKKYSSGYVLFNQDQNEDTPPASHLNMRPPIAVAKKAFILSNSI